MEIVFLSRVLLVGPIHYKEDRIRYLSSLRLFDIFVYTIIIIHVKSLFFWVLSGHMNLPFFGQN